MPSGSIPPDQRRLARNVTIIMAICLVCGTLTINWVTGSPIDWFWLVGGSLFITLLMVLFLWVRLSE